MHRIPRSGPSGSHPRPSPRAPSHAPSRLPIRTPTPHFSASSLPRGPSIPFHGPAPIRPRMYHPIPYHPRPFRSRRYPSRIYYTDPFNRYYYLYDNIPIYIDSDDELADIIVEPVVMSAIVSPTLPTESKTGSESPPSSSSWTGSNLVLLVLALLLLLLLLGIIYGYVIYSMMKS